MSSLVFLGLSVILFFIVYGIAFIIMPMILGAFFTLMDSNIFNVDNAWLDIYETNKETVQFLVPLMPTIGIVIAVIKILMTASARGRD